MSVIDRLFVGVCELLSLITIVLFGVYRISLKKKANTLKVTISSNTIQTEKEFEKKIFSKKNVNQINWKIINVSDEFYFGNLYIKERNNTQKYVLLGLENENEKYLIDDLNWFKSYFERHLNNNLG